MNPFCWATAQKGAAGRVTRLLDPREHAELICHLDIALPASKWTPEHPCEVTVYACPPRNRIEAFSLASHSQATALNQKRNRKAELRNSPKKYETWGLPERLVLCFMFEAGESCLQTATRYLGVALSASCFFRKPHKRGESHTLLV